MSNNKTFKSFVTKLLRMCSELLKNIAMVRSTAACVIDNDQSLLAVMRLGVFQNLPKLLFFESSRRT